MVPKLFSQTQPAKNIERSAQKVQFLKDFI